MMTGNKSEEIRYAPCCLEKEHDENESSGKILHKDW